MKNLTSLQLKTIYIFSLNAALILSAVGRAILYERNPMRYFGEGGYITWLSCFQLLYMGYLCHKLSLLRLSQHSALKGWRHPYQIWRTMMLGFIFLALDDYFRIHETLDNIIRIYFDLRAQAWDRIDDFIVLLYVMAGAAFLWISRKEIKLFSPSFKWFIIGFCLCFLTIAFDMWTQNPAVMSFFLHGEGQLRTWSRWLSVLEEIFKVLAEAVFIVAFEHCLTMAKSQSRYLNKD